MRNAEIKILQAFGFNICQTNSFFLQDDIWGTILFYLEEIKDLFSTDDNQKSFSELHDFSADILELLYFNHEVLSYQFKGVDTLAVSII